MRRRRLALVALGLAAAQDPTVAPTTAAPTTGSAVGRADHGGAVGRADHGRAVGRADRRPRRPRPRRRPRRHQNRRPRRPSRSSPPCNRRTSPRGSCTRRGAGGRACSTFWQRTRCTSPTRRTPCRARASASTARGCTSRARALRPPVHARRRRRREGVGRHARAADARGGRGPGTARARTSAELFRNPSTPRAPTRASMALYHHLGLREPQHVFSHGGRRGGHAHRLPEGGPRHQAAVRRPAGPPGALGQRPMELRYGGFTVGRRAARATTTAVGVGSHATARRGRRLWGSRCCSGGCSRKDMYLKNKKRAP